MVLQKEANDLQDGSAIAPVIGCWGAGQQKSGIIKNPSLSLSIWLLSLMPQMQALKAGFLKGTPSRPGSFAGDSAKLIACDRALFHAFQKCEPPQASGCSLTSYMPLSCCTERDGVFESNGMLNVPGTRTFLSAKSERKIARRIPLRCHPSLPNLCSRMRQRKCRCICCLGPK